MALLCPCLFGIKIPQSWVLNNKIHLNRAKFCVQSFKQLLMSYLNQPLPLLFNETLFNALLNIMWHHPCTIPSHFFVWKITWVNKYGLIMHICCFNSLQCVCSLAWYSRALRISRDNILDYNLVEINMSSKFTIIRIDVASALKTWNKIKQHQSLKYKL